MSRARRAWRSARPHLGLADGVEIAVQALCGLLEPQRDAVRS